MDQRPSPHLLAWGFVVTVRSAVGGKRYQNIEILGSRSTAGHTLQTPNSSVMGRAPLGCTNVPTQLYTEISRHAGISLPKRPARQGAGWAACGGGGVTKRRPLSASWHGPSLAAGPSGIWGEPVWNSGTDATLPRLRTAHWRDWVCSCPRLRETGPCTSKHRTDSEAFL